MPKSKDSFEKVIFATDAVGFSKLVSNNEYKTLASLKECLQIISSTLVSYEGRIFHSAGDSVLAEFPSAVDVLIGNEKGDVGSVQWVVVVVGVSWWISVGIGWVCDYDLFGKWAVASDVVDDVD